MPNNRKPATGSDARAITRKPPTRAAIDSALKFYAGARHRPPDDPGNGTAPVATEAADTTETYTAKHTAITPKAQPVSHTLMLARLMPNACAALLANGAAVAGLAQLLPVTAAALSGALR